MIVETTRSVQSNIDILKVSGRVLMADTENFEGSIKEIHAKTNKLVIDLSETKYMCSTALGILIASKRRIMRHGGDLILVVDNGDVMDVLRLTMIDKLIHLEQDLDRAVQLILGA